jgi:ribosome-associated heat shock protein Hsp15
VRKTKPEHMPASEDARQAQRLDKWLWHARIVKTRSLAAQFVDKGKFRINREKVSKPSHAVKAGDVITAAIFGRVRILQIAGFSDKRGPAAEARALYIDLTPQDEGTASSCIEPKSAQRLSDRSDAKTKS